ncbi:MAG TPA: prepilin-type N-terminal cleavage/methylation domain-containing protein [Candidatus Paceibacterota bacterium]|nr:prepilin-type N-terminal cleavage/methylation domain-containing protein [Candidatus Paceibacterota bacterium]
MRKIFQNKGFTLIEVMIATTLFSIIMVIGTGAVLNSNTIFRKTENLRTIIDNLHFVMEDMSRSIRTGHGYDCGASIGVSEGSLTPTDCSSSINTISFLASESTADPADDDFVVYYIDQVNQRIEKKTKEMSPSDPYFVMTVPEIKINFSKSGFVVSGAAQGVQPRVLIRLAGEIVDPRQNVVTPFNIQTTVSQRATDS